jgi:hypothetical protein
MTGSTDNNVIPSPNVVYSDKTNKQHKKLLKELFGKVVVNVYKVRCDEGFVLEFNDGTTLEVGYSGCEGSTYLNNNKFDVKGTKK